MPAGLFLSIEGIDGSGKSTQLQLLTAKLGKQGIAYSDPLGWRSLSWVVDDNAVMAITYPESVRDFFFIIGAATVATTAKTQPVRL